MFRLDHIVQGRRGLVDEYWLRPAVYHGEQPCLLDRRERRLRLRIGEPVLDAHPGFIVLHVYDLRHELYAVVVQQLLVRLLVGAVHMTPLLETCWVFADAPVTSIVLEDSYVWKRQRFTLRRQSPLY